MKLLIKALFKFIMGLILASVLIFLPAGTFKFLNGWLFIALLFVPILLLGITLYFKAPELLEKRLESKENESTQKAVVAVCGLLFIGGFIIAGFDFRFGWTKVSKWVVILASIVLLVSYLLYAEVMRENAYLSRTVRVEENQTVVDTGLYGIIRHPMYAVTFWLFLSFPLVLGSWAAFFCFLAFLPVFVLRILNEEKVLEKELDGYIDYKKKVKYRLLPFIW